MQSDFQRLLIAQLAEGQLGAFVFVGLKFSTQVNRRRWLKSTHIV